MYPSLPLLCHALQFNNKKAITDKSPLVRQISSLNHLIFFNRVILTFKNAVFIYWQHWVFVAVIRLSLVTLHELPISVATLVECGLSSGTRA